MSDKNHTNEAKILFWLDKELVFKLDEALKKMGYKNRAEWFRENVRDIIEIVETKKIKKKGLAKRSGTMLTAQMEVGR